MNRSRRFALPAAFATGFFMVLWISSVFLTRAGLRSSAAPYHERYGEALKHGRLWIQESPNLAGCAWDLSFHEGRCYLYWGIVPAIVHAAIPIASDRVVTLVMSALSVFFLILLMQALTPAATGPDAARAPPTGTAVVLGVFLAFLTGLPATMLASRVYEESIATGIAFGLAGLVLFFESPSDSTLPTTTAWRVIGGVGCLVVAGLARSPWFLVAAGVLAALAWRQVRERSWRGARGLIGAGAVVLIGAGMQLGLNAARFGDPLEFGIAKQASVVATKASGAATIAPRFIPQNTANYFFTALPPVASPLVMSFRPFGLPLPRVTAISTRGLLYPEFGLALFAVMPTLLLGIVALAQLWHTNRRAVSRLALASAVTLPLAIPVLASAGYMYRYQLEANLFILVLVVPPLLAVDSRRVLVLHVIAACTGAAVVGINTLWVVKMVCATWGYC
jgi:hypothetical protein